MDTGSGVFSALATSFKIFRARRRLALVDLLVADASNASRVMRFPKTTRSVGSDELPRPALRFACGKTFVRVWLIEQGRGEKLRMGRGSDKSNVINQLQVVRIECLSYRLGESIT